MEIKHKIAKDYVNLFLPSPFHFLKTGMMYNYKSGELREENLISRLSTGNTQLRRGLINAASVQIEGFH